MILKATKNPNRAASELQENNPFKGDFLLMRLFDTHAHLSYPDLAEIETEVLSNAQSAGVEGICAIGTDLRSSYACVDLATRHDCVYASVGIHPNDAHNANRDHWKEIQQLAEHKKVVALGETGLDRHWDDCPFEIQKEWFAKHIEFSHETGLPLVVHMRECEQDILESFREHHRQGQIIGIMHSFTGTADTAKECLDFGMYISFAGMLTYKNAADIRAVAKEIPLDRLLVETDSPYLTPHPHRGKRPNQPHMVLHTANCLAETLGLSPDAMGQQTTENARQVFGI